MLYRSNLRTIAVLKKRRSAEPANITTLNLAMENSKPSGLPFSDHVSRNDAIRPRKTRTKAMQATPEP